MAAATHRARFAWPPSRLPSWDERSVIKNYSTHVHHYTKCNNICGKQLSYSIFYKAGSVYARDVLHLIRFEGRLLYSTNRNKINIQIKLPPSHSSIRRLSAMDNMVSRQYKWPQAHNTRSIRNEDIPQAEAALKTRKSQRQLTKASSYTTTPELSSIRVTGTRLQNLIGRRACLDIQ